MIHTVSRIMSQVQLDSSHYSSPFLILKGLQVIEHAWSTIEVCLTAMMIWKAFIVRDHLRMIHMLWAGCNKSDSSPSRSPSDEQNRRISSSSVPLARFVCMVKIQSFHTSENFYQPDERFYSNVTDRIGSETSSADPFTTD